MKASHLFAHLSHAAKSNNSIGWRMLRKVEHTEKQARRAEVESMIIKLESEVNRLMHKHGDEKDILLLKSRVTKLKIALHKV